jgi:GNAT superfamily N-acetyltransferase
MIEKIDIVDPIPPALLPKPYKGSLPEFAMFKHEGGGHDQMTHGNWADGNADIKTGLERLASQFDDFENFSRAISQDTLRPRAWHIAGDDFELDPNFEPSGRLGEPTRGGGLFVGSPEYWEEYATNRDTVIEFDLSNLDFTSNPLQNTNADFYADQSGNQGFFVRPTAFPKLQEVGRYTLDEAKERAEQQQKQMPKSKAEAREIWERARNVAKHQAGQHDQQSHGNWATGYTEAERAGIEAMQDEGPTLEEIQAFLKGGRPKPLTMEQATLLINNEEELYEAYVAAVGKYVSDKNPKADADKLNDLIETALNDDTYIERYIEDYDIRTEFSEELQVGRPDEIDMMEKFNEVYGVSVDDGKLETVVEGVKRLGENTIEVTGNVYAAQIVVGGFERVLSLNRGALSVEHQLFQIEPDYRGLGLGQEFLRRSEDWYIARGITKIGVRTAWDGAYTWSRAGFDFSRPMEAVRTLIKGVRNAVNNDVLDVAELDVWRDLLERSTEGLNLYQKDGDLFIDYESTKDINVEDFPLPAEFARAPQAKEVMRDMGMGMVKYLTPEGRALAEGPIDRDGDGMVFDGTPRERPARPSERVAAAKWSARDTKLQAISNAYYKYGKDDFMNENEGSDQDNPELDKAIDKILGKNSFMKRLMSFSYSVIKHQAGTHDQQSHGNWADGLGYRDKNFDRSGLSQDDITKAYREAGVSEGKINQEVEALAFYTGAGFSDINRTLREQELDPTLDDSEWTTEQIEGAIFTVFSDEYKNYQNFAGDDASLEDFIDTNIERITEYLEGAREERLTAAERLTSPLRGLIERMPAMLGNTTVYRVFSKNVTDELDVGDVITDKGFLSTTARDLTNPQEAVARSHFADMSGTDDVVGVILPKSGGDGKGLYVNSFLEAIGEPIPPFFDTESEVLLPPSTRLRLVRVEKRSAEGSNGLIEDVYVFEREN